MGLFDVSPASIREIPRAWYPNLSLEELIKLRIHDLDAAWIERVRGQVTPGAGGPPTRR